MLGLGSGVNKMSSAEAAAIAGRLPGFTGLLDESYGASAEAAYSVRKLTNRVSVAMTIRRDSDSTEADIGFDSNGNLDEGAITAFCTGTTCRVASWKDQSGNDNHAVQAVASNQPTIYTGGALVKENGRLALDFDGSNDYFEMPSPFSGTTPRSTFFTGYSTENPTSASVIYGANVQATNSGDNYNITTEIGLRVNQYALWDDDYQGTSRKLLTTTWSSGTAFDAQMYLDGVQLSTSSGNSTVDLNTAAHSTSWIARTSYNPDNYLTAVFSEMIFYASDKSGTDRTSIESNIGDYFTQNTPLLDTYSGAAAAYSLRKLSSSYSGPAIRVRRDNDNSETDINFNVFGELDTVSLAAHCGSNNGYVTNWYDQSSNSNTARQTTAANQPKIYDGTTGVVTENGKPAVENVLSGAQGLNIPSFTINLSDFTCTLVSKFYADSGTEGRPIMINGDLLASYDYRYKQFSIARGKFYLGTSTVQSFFNNVSYTSTNNLQLHTITPTNGYVDGTSAGTFGTAGEDLDLNPAFNYLTSGDIGRDRGTHANTSEVIIWTADQTGNRAGIETNIATFYDITI